MAREKRNVEKGNRLWYRLVLFLVPRLVTGYFRLVDFTSKKIFLNREYEDQVCKKRPFACACFHGTMLFPVYYCRRYPGVVMVSRSWDGELIDRSIRRMGYEHHTRIVFQGWKRSPLGDDRHYQGTQILFRFGC